MTLNWYPVIDYKKCVGCLACANFCQHGVYSVENGLPVVSNRKGCVDGCRGCEPVCPNSAITHVRKKLPNKKSSGDVCKDDCKCESDCKCAPDNSPK